MNDKLNCPICSESSDVLDSSPNGLLKVYFCYNCLEHFTNKDSVTSMISRARNSTNIIDEEFIKKYNSMIQI